MMSKVCLVALAVLVLQTQSLPQNREQRVKRQQVGFNWGNGGFFGNGGQNQNNQNQNNQNGQNPNIPVTQAPATTTTTPSPRYTQCFNSCPKTPEYNPVCANNNVTYQNDAHLRCANQCGLRIRKVFGGTCSAL